MQGEFLIAHPMLQDGYFKRAVIYLTEDNDEGSLGFILNFRTHYLLRDLFPHIKNGNFPIFEGGPVSKDQLYYIHNLGKNITDSVQIKDDLWWGGDFFELAHMIDHGKVKTHNVKFFMGYSGWTAGQLKDELIQKAWFKNEAEPAIILQSDPENLWGDELEKIKESYKVFSNIGFDPNLN
jgi:putative transcriptional regulator